MSSASNQIAIIRRRRRTEAFSAPSHFSPLVECKPGVVFVGCCVCRTDGQRPTIERCIHLRVATRKQNELYGQSQMRCSNEHLFITAAVYRSWSAYIHQFIAIRLSFCVCVSLPVRLFRKNGSGFYFLFYVDVRG